MCEGFFDDMRYKNLRFIYSLLLLT